MALTYAQKRFIQEHFGSKTNEEIATELGVSQTQIEKHIKKQRLVPHAQKKKDEVSNPLGNKIHYLYLALLALIVLVVYANGFFSDFVSDDVYVLVNDEQIYQSWSYFLVNPLMFVRAAIFFTVYHAVGLVPFAYRIFNVIFHIGFVWMIYLIMPYFSQKKYLPFIVACLAAVHPMMVESVTWISGGVYAQSGFFLLLSFYFYIKGRKDNNVRHLWYALGIFVLALSSSEKVIVFPFTLALYEYVFHAHKHVWRWVMGYFSISFFWGLMFLGRVNDRLEYLQVTNGTESKFQFNNPFVQVPVALSKYFELFFWPDKLTLYQSEYAMDLMQYAVRAGVAIIFFTIVVVAYKHHKQLFFWLSFFFISLLTTMNPFGLSWIVAERYFYVGSVGLYFAFTLLLYQLIKRKNLQALGYTILVVIIIALSTRTIIRNIDWHNEDNLWKATARVSPSDPKTHNNMGDVYARQGDYVNAAKSFEEALRLNPNYPDATHNLANINRLQGNKDKAFELYKRAVELNPAIWQSHINLAALYFEDQNYEQSLSHALKADEITGSNPQTKLNLGIIYQALGDTQNAEKYFQETLILDPTNQQAQEALAKLKNTE